MHILSAADIRAALTMPEAIAAVRAGFIALSTGKATVPVRTVLSTPDGLTLYMPAYIDGAPISTVKVVSVYPRNITHNLPTVTAKVLVLDSKTGLPLALMDGTVLTALRTGAASGLATELLALPQATVLGIIGAGVQARTQIEAICTVRSIQQIRIYSLNRAATLADELRRQYSGIDIMVASSPHEALVEAEIIVAATNSKTPVVHLADVMPGVHINGMGSFTPEMQEVAAEVVHRARVIVDHRASAWAEAGDLIIPRDQGLIREDHAATEIGEVAAGLIPGRTSADEITFFKSVGNAVQDATVAARVLEVATARGLGKIIDI